MHKDPGSGAMHAHLIARVGGLRMGVPVEWVREVLARQEPLDNLPRHAGAVAGLMKTGHGPMPVVELGRWVAIPARDAEATAPDAMDPAVLVLNQGGHSVGVQVDALEGMRTLDDAQIRCIHHEGNPEELFERLATVDGEPDICLLTPQRLMALSAIWLDEAAAADAITPAEDTAHLALDAAVGGEYCLRLRCGDRALAVPVALVGELLPMPALRSRWTEMGATLGVAHWRERPLAVIDLNQLLNGGPAAASLMAPWAVTLRDDAGRALMLAVDEFLGLSRVPADAQPPEPGTSRWLGSRWLEAPGPQGQPQACQRLAAEAMLAELPEAGLSGTGSAHTERVKARPGNTQPYMLFDAGGAFAAAVSDVQAVLPRPASTGTGTGGSEQPGELVEWRGRTVPIRPLAIAAAATRAGSNLLLLVGQGARLQAVPIQRLLALVPRHAAELSPLPGGRGALMLSVREPAASYRVLSVVEMIGVDAG